MNHYQPMVSLKTYLYDAQLRVDELLDSARRAMALGYPIEPLMEQFHEAQRRVKAAAQADLQNMGRHWRSTGDFHSVGAVGCAR